jgi:hypothetical protein
MQKRITQKKETLPIRSIQKPAKPSAHQRVAFYRRCGKRKR